MRPCCDTYTALMLQLESIRTEVKQFEERIDNMILRVRHYDEEIQSEFLDGMKQDLKRLDVLTKTRRGV